MASAHWQWWACLAVIKSDFFSVQLDCIKQVTSALPSPVHIGPACVESLGYSGNADRNERVYGGGAGQHVLSEGHRCARAVFLLRDAVWHGGVGQHVLPDAGDFQGEGMVREDAAGILARGEGAAGDYARKDAGELRGESEAFSGNDE